MDEAFSDNENGYHDEEPSPSQEAYLDARDEFLSIIQCFKQYRYEKKALARFEELMQKNPRQAQALIDSLNRLLRRPKYSLGWLKEARDGAD